MHLPQTSVTPGVYRAIKRKYQRKIFLCVAGICQMATFTPHKGATFHFDESLYTQRLVQRTLVQRIRLE